MHRARAPASNRRKVIMTGAWLACCVAYSCLIAPLFAPCECNAYEQEALRLTDNTLNTFWNSRARIFSAPEYSAEAVRSEGVFDNGYTLWPTVVMFTAAVDGERRCPGHFTTWISTIYDGMEQYFDAERHAYNAWLHFPGNNDKYYDDNSLVVSGLVKAYEATGVTMYLDRAEEVFNGFVVNGWDGSSSPGGVRWGTLTEQPPHTDRGACSTEMAACAALYLARNGRDTVRNEALATEMLAWVSNNLQDDVDGLVRDALRFNSISGSWEVVPTKWTYNTGNLILGYVLLHEQTSNQNYLDEALLLAKSATNRSRALYDGLVIDPARKYWYDASFFVHHLVDGLTSLNELDPDPELVAEVRRNVDYAMLYLKDTGDGLYWRNWRLWTIDEERCDAWRALTGQDQAPVLDPSERSLENTGIPVEDRPMAKTLLGNAGMCRLLWLAGAVLT